MLISAEATCHGNIDSLALPGNPDLLATVGGLDTSISIGTSVKGGNEIAVRVDGATGTGDAILSEPGTTEIWVRNENNKQNTGTYAYNLPE